MEISSASLYNGEDNPRNTASHQSDKDAFQWVLNKLLKKRTELWAHLFLEKRTIHESDEVDGHGYQSEALVGQGPRRVVSIQRDAHTMAHNHQLDFA